MRNYSIKSGKLGTVSAFLGVFGFLALVHQPAWGDRVLQQVQIEAKFVEANQNNLKDLGFDWMLAQKLAKLPPGDSALPASVPTDLGLGSAPTAETVGQHIFPEVEPGKIKAASVLTVPQTRILLDSLSAEKSFKLLSAPVLRVSSNQPAAIDVSSAIGANGQGVFLNITPTLTDSGAIRLSLTPQGQDFHGPATNIEISSGQTLIVGGLAGKTREPKDNLIFVVTPQIVGVLSHSPGGKEPEKIKVETSGTGETIGHVANLKVQNLTDEALDLIVPALILESSTGKSQDYVCPEEESVTVSSRQTEVIPVRGVCINRDKAPVGKGVSGGLILNTIDPGIAQHPDCHIPAGQAIELIRICDSIYRAAGQLQKEGLLKDFPYTDKQEQEDILVEWCIWTNPRICEISKAPPATKDDMKKVVYKQLDQKGKSSSETKKKIDQGIDTIFEKVELTSTKAKDLEKPGQPGQDQSPAPSPAATPSSSPAAAPKKS